MKKTKLQPKQVMFLKYLLTYEDISYYPTVCSIEYTLEYGEYINDGPSCDMLNRLRDKYMKNFVKFEEQFPDWMRG